MGLLLPTPHDVPSIRTRLSFSTLTRTWCLRRLFETGAQAAPPSPRVKIPNLPPSQISPAAPPRRLAPADPALAKRNLPLVRDRAIEGPPIFDWPPCGHVMQASLPSASGEVREEFEIAPQNRVLRSWYRKGIESRCFVGQQA